MNNSLSIFARWRVLAFVGFVLIVCWSVYGPVMMNLISPERFYFTVTADLVVNGQAITMSGTARCQWDQYPVWPTARDRSRFVKTGGLVAKRLPDGSALLIRTGNFCKGAPDMLDVLFDENPDVATVEPRRIGAVNFERWYVALLDDATTPSRIDVYAGPKYFNQSQRRVHLRRLAVSRGRTGQLTDFTSEVPWLSAKVSGEASGLPFWGFFARVSPREEWSQYSEVSKFLSAAKEPISDVSFALRNADVEQSPPVASDGRLIPISDDDDTFKLATDDLARGGMFTLLPRSVPPRLSGRCIGTPIHWLGYPDDGLSTRQLVIDGRPIAVSLQHSTSVFDPVGGLIVHVGYMCIKPGQMFGETE